ncbi:hypothetical protein [Halomonas piscis]|uniref:hypothetical protein n=1 Tax=Halomonas piscis TaxID=3031727 RepID=UPI00289F7964|nr:hypothetical protein [Halomonas piscis]
MSHDIAYNLPRIAHSGRVQVYGVNGRYRYRLTNGQGDIEHRSTNWPGGTYDTPELALRDGLLRDSNTRLAAGLDAVAMACGKTYSSAVDDAMSSYERAYQGPFYVLRLGHGVLGRFAEEIDADAARQAAIEAYVTALESEGVSRDNALDRAHDGITLTLEA